MMYYLDEELSPTDTSEDSIEISVKQIHKKLFTKSKRKSCEPRRVKVMSLVDDLKTAPAPDYNKNSCSPKRRSLSPSCLAPKKRFKLDALLEMERQKSKEEQEERPNQSKSEITPFRPWQDLEGRVPAPSHPALPLLLSYALSVHSNPLPEQEEPLALVVDKASSTVGQKKSPLKADRRIADKVSRTDNEDKAGSAKQHKKQTNYKSMTKDRRIEANARERQRVHTITAAFDTLQAAIPTDEENIKLSKLSVVKIATAYIMALSRMAGYDYTEDRSAPSVESVLEHCRQTITNETKIKKRS